MGRLLNLKDYGTRAVLREYGLTPARRLGRGTFCAVYDSGPEAVWKLTTDAVQMESVRNYLIGPHYPALLDNEGCVGTQGYGDNELDLYLFKSERLNPTREADLATRRLARQVLKTADSAWSSEAASKSAEKHRAIAPSRSARSLTTVELLCEDQTLSASIRTAFEDLLRLMLDYGDLSLDLHGANLMVRGSDELVFNDIICCGTLINQ